MKYNCINCKYETDNRFSWHSHNKSKNHIGKTVGEVENKIILENEGETNMGKNKYKCENCGIEYTRGSGIFGVSSRLHL